MPSHMSHRFGSAARLLAAVVALAAPLACSMAAPAAARQKVYRSVPTRVSFSAAKGPDGTVTVEAAFRSPDPRCLEGKRFLQKHKDGNYWVAGGDLYFGGAFTAPEEFSGNIISEPFGFDGFATPQSMPSKGLLAPMSRAGRSPYVWQATWPGSTEVFVTNFYDKSMPRHYDAPVSAATGVSLGAIARASKGQGLPYYKVAFNRGRKHIILKCKAIEQGDAVAKIGL